MFFKQHFLRLLTHSAKLFFHPGCHHQEKLVTLCLVNNWLQEAFLNSQSAPPDCGLRDHLWHTGHFDKLPRIMMYIKIRRNHRWEQRVALLLKSNQHSHARNTSTDWISTVNHIGRQINDFLPMYYCHEIGNKMNQTRYQNRNKLGINKSGSILVVVRLNKKY